MIVKVFEENYVWMKHLEEKAMGGSKNAALKINDVKESDALLFALKLVIRQAGPAGRNPKYR